MTKKFIPTINISSLIKNNFETQSAFKTIKKIEKACIKVGFFQITGHGINLKVIKKNLIPSSKIISKNLKKLDPKFHVNSILQIYRKF
mgnify:CR=1 FL=1